MKARLILAGLVILVLVLVGLVAIRPEASPAEASTASLAAAVARASGGLLEYRGQVRFPTGYTFHDTEVGGLSALAYNAEQDLLYALSDDRSEKAPARFYTLRMDLGDGWLRAGDLLFTDVTFLRNEAGETFPPGGIDPEGLAFGGGTTLFLSSEGDARNGLPPFVWEITTSGNPVRSFPLPPYYLPAPGVEKGVRNNLGFEALALSSDGSALYTATESALAQDGPPPSVGEASPSRILRFDRASAQVTGELLYRVEPVAHPPFLPLAFSTRGLNGLLPLPADALAGTPFLSLERSYSQGAGFTLQLFRLSLAEAENLQGRESLAGAGGAKGAAEAIRGAEKTLLLDFADADLPLDNFEGLALGPRLPDGRPSLLVVSDNNFSAIQATYFLLFALGQASQ